MGIRVDNIDQKLKEINKMLTIQEQNIENESLSNKPAFIHIAISTGIKTGLRLALDILQNDNE